MTKIVANIGMYVVTVYEHEIWKDIKVIYKQCYKSEEEAKAACYEINKHNIETDPDYYIAATYSKV